MLNTKLYATIASMKEKIQKVLDDLHQILDQAVGPNSRAEYMREISVQGIDWHFSLSADDIINKKVPKRVIGCTGVAKLFCKLATDAGLKCMAVCTAYEPDWRAVRDGDNRIVDGHQVIAVEIDGRLRVFDPGRKELKFIDTDVKIGNLVDFKFSDRKGMYLITAVMEPSDYAKIDSYQKLFNVYASGDINNPKFVIKPNYKEDCCAIKDIFSRIFKR